MICPFRVGIKFDYELVGPGKQKTSDNYIEVAQHATYEDCYEDECPYFVRKWDDEGSCSKVDDD